MRIQEMRDLILKIAAEDEDFDIEVFRNGAWDSLEGPLRMAKYVNEDDD